MKEGAPRPAQKQETVAVPEKSQDDIIRNIDFILEHHEPLRETWEAMVEDLPLEQQLIKLEDLAAKRREMLAPKPYISNKLYVLDDNEFTENLFNEAIKIITERSEEVGRGYNGRVIEFQASPDADSNIVYKVLMRAPIGEQNDLLSEASYLAELHALSETYQEGGVGVPKPFYCATKNNARIIAMQKVPGLSLERIMADDVDLPADLDLDKLEENLLDFINHINDSGFYHNDLRPGNVMFDMEHKDPDSPKVYLVDTGSSKYEHHAQGKIDNAKDRVMLKQVFQSLKNYQSRQSGKKSV